MSKKMYKICWFYPPTKIYGEGKLIENKKAAIEGARLMNLEYPEITHWVEEHGKFTEQTIYPKKTKNV